MPGRVDIAAPGRVRLGAALLAAGLNLLLVLALIRAFAPDLAGRAVDAVVSTFVVEAPTPSPTPESPPSPQAGAGAGTQGAAGKRAVPRAVAAPPSRIVVATAPPAPPVAATGKVDTAGARDEGQASGAGMAGSGQGSGGAGDGQGGGGAGGLIKIAGEINNTRDYPAATRDLRIGSSVIIALTVGTDGKPTACRVVRPSRDPDADAITCRLALARFRFRPATNAAGQPVVATYGWQQRWFYRGG